jgi:poly(A) polymerase
MTAPETRDVLAALGAGGAAVRFVGGCVRDAILARPVKDIDVATPEPPETVMERLAAAGIKAIPTGIAHGTVTAVAGKAHFEITTLRRDVETFGRRARVAFTDDWTADAARRDFTINALFCDPDGTLYDPSGGLADLHAGRVRFVGEAEERIREDVLRLLRFFRFHAWYGAGAPDQAALAACRKLAPEMVSLSAERVWSELRRMLAAPAAAAVLRLMADWDVLVHALPEAVDLARLDALARVEDEVGEPADAIRRLAASLNEGAGTEGAEALARRLRMSNAERRRLCRLAAPEFSPAPGMDRRARRAALYRLGRQAFRDLALIGWAAAQVAGADDAAAWRTLYADGRAWQPVKLPVAGRDAMDFGVPRGKPMGVLLGAVEAWWVANDFSPGRAACRTKLEELARKAGFGKGPGT